MYSVSWIYALIEHNNKIAPKLIINWRIAITGSNTKCHEVPTPYETQNNNVMIHEIKKFTKPLNATDNGRISLGKYTFLIIPALFLMTETPWDSTEVKNVHGMIATTRKIKYGTS